MNQACASCGTILSSPWRFCPLCGATVAGMAQEPSTARETEKAPVKNAYSGLLFGLIVAPMCVIVGGMLCLTGLGAFLGVPLIFAGILAPLLGPMIGLSELKGKCPWCGAEVNNVVNTPAFACHRCGERIVVRQQRLEKAA